MPRAKFLRTFALLASAPLAGPICPAKEPAVDFERQIAPIFVKHCLDCHNPTAASGGLALTEKSRAMAGGDSGAVLVAGSPDESYLYDRASDGSMPPKGKGERLTEAEVDALARWIEAGCPWTDGRILSPYEYTTSRRAGYDWWSLIPVQKPVPPEIENGQADHPIDRFLLASLAQQKLGFSPPADRLTLVRRATFDLTGLPPTPEEARAFAEDESPQAYARLIDRLLASPRYGERWAQHWLDVVRFSESKGFERDRLRENSWRYRDWVIEALNRDLPYDDFVRRQLAGDALAPDDPNACVPMGFLVTGPNDDVGNGSELERKRTRADELDDFVTNTSAALLGLTIGCARCHDHKFDPIPTADYYRLVAVFSGIYYGDRPLATDAQVRQRKEKVAEIDSKIAAVDQTLADLDSAIANLQGDKSSARKNEIEFPVVEGRFVRIEIDRTSDGSEACIDEIEIYTPGSNDNLAVGAGTKASASSVLAGFPIHKIVHLNDGQYGNEHSWVAGNRGPGWVQIELARSAAIGKIVWGRDRNGHYTDRVPEQYSVLISADGETWRVVAQRPQAKSSTPEQLAKLAELKSQRESPAALRRQLEEQKSDLPEFITSWAAIGKTPEKTFVLRRGDVTTPGDEVGPGAVSAIKSLDCDLGTSASTDRQRRLALADWIVSPQNPLTARVIVNRLWQHHFGAGLVDNPSDFGFASGRPSHPELLDWLAAELVEQGWSLKQMHRQIMLSAAYRQACRPNADASRIDADNRLLWRANRYRLEAETLRDCILFTAGSLDETRGGPSFRLFKYTDGNIPVYEPLAGEDRTTWRRTIYRHVVRSQSVPFLDVFDCPDSSVMTARRSRTTTPLQALSLLNNAFVLRQSALFAKRLRHDCGDAAAAQVRRAVELVYGRPPSGDETELLVRFVERYGLAELGRVLWNSNEFLYVN